MNKAALARLYARGGQYRQAIEGFRSLLELEPNRDRMDLKVALAETLWLDGRREQAAEIAREILQISPDCLKAILLLGVIQIEKSRDDEGWAILANARGLDPENRVAQALFGEGSPLPPQIVKIPRIKKEPQAEAVPEVAEPVLPSVEEEAAPEVEPEEEAIPEEEPEAEAAPEVAEPVLPSAEEEAIAAAAPEEEAISEEATLASAAAITPAPLSDVERYKLHLQQKPKDDETRLALARAYRDQEQIKLALEQYGILKRAKSNLLAEVIHDMETVVASRPDSLESHELLADLYVKDGRLQQAVDRYRWVLQRLDKST
jgi:tetratricopeptide (TPR) repeat protein